MEITFILNNTTFELFASQIDYEFLQIHDLLFPAEDGTQYRIGHDWKEELGPPLAFIGRNIPERLEKLGEYIIGRMGVWILPDGDINTVTDMATMSIFITSPELNSIRVTIYVRFDELPDFCPPAIRDRLSELLRFIAHEWPQSQPQFREALPKLRPFVSRQEQGRWREILMETNEPPSLPVNFSSQESNEPTPPQPDDPTDQRILQWVTDDPDLTDQQIGQLLGGISRQAVNARRRTLQKMGHKVR